MTNKENLDLVTDYFESLFPGRGLILITVETDKDSPLITFSSNLEIENVNGILENVSEQINNSGYIDYGGESPINN